MATVTGLKKLSDYVSSDYLLDLVLNRFGISKAQLNRNVSDISKSEDTDLSFLLEILTAFEEPEMLTYDRFEPYPIPVILNYLQKTHQYYETKRLLEMEQSIQQLLFRNPEVSPLIEILEMAFKEYKKELLEHIQMEENELFPYIISLQYAIDNVAYTPQKKALVLSNQLDNFIAEHDTEVEHKLLNIRDKITEYNPALKGLLAFKIFNTQLEYFQKDLHIHGFIEDHVLIPKTQQLEQEILRN